MANSMRKVLLALGTAGLLGGCATGYYDDYGYYGDRHAYAPAPGYYYDTYPGYVGPSVGLGFGYAYHDRTYRHHRRGDRHDWRRDRHEGDRHAFVEPRNPDGSIPAQRLGTDNRGTTYWQGADGRVYEGTLPPGKNPTASGG